jgi:hypothetical protein
MHKLASALVNPVASVKITDEHVGASGGVNVFDVFAKILVLSAALTLLK